MTRSRSDPGRPSTTDSGRRAGVRPGLGVAAGIGLLALLAAMAVAELVAGFTGPGTVPVVAVGSAVIPLTPETVKERAIALFGTSDKTALIIGTCVAVALFAVLAGVLARRRRTLGNAVVLALAAAGAAAAATRPTAAMLDVLPSVAAGVVGVLVLESLTRRHAALRPAAEPPPQTPAPQPSGRRGFLGAVGAVLAVTVGSGSVGAFLIRKRYDKAAARTGVVLPRPASRAVAQPAGAQVAQVASGPLTSAPPTASPLSGQPTIPAASAVPTIPAGSALPTVPAGSALPTVPPAAGGSRVVGVSDFFTSNDAFYRIDTALVVPELEASTWELRIHGMVRHELRLSYAELVALPLVERDITLSCVSNDVGGGLISNARWVGTLLAPLLRRAGVLPGAEQLVSRDVHGMTIGTPVAAVLDGRDAMLAVGMNGTTLPFQHGFPVRMVVPGLYGYVSACKWVVDIEVTTWRAYDAYWVQRGWSQQGPIKVESRIDVPRSSVRAGVVPVAGVAWAPHTGIGEVEVRIGDGPWEAATLAPVATDDTWRQWVYPWHAVAGTHRLQVRATDARGVQQTPAQAQPFPSGATGWHSVTVTVS